MKISQIIGIVGNLAMLVGCIFLIINHSTGKEIFESYVTLPLMIMGIIGNVCTLIKTNKRK